MAENIQLAATLEGTKKGHWEKLNSQNSTMTCSTVILALTCVVGNGKVVTNTENNERRVCLQEWSSQTSSVFWWLQTSLFSGCPNHEIG
jgi:hypothetical protein